MRLDRAQRGDRGGGVLMLMAADEMRRRQIEKAAFVLEDKTAIFFPGVVIPPARDDRRAQAPRLTVEHRKGGVFLGAQNGERASFEDSGLFIRDFIDRRAEELGMIDRDRRDDRGRRARDDIGGIVPAAETDFQQQIIGGMLAEKLECRCGGHFEEGDRLARIGAFTCGQGGKKLGIADELVRRVRTSLIRSWKRTRCGEV